MSVGWLPTETLLNQGASREAAIYIRGGTVMHTTREHQSTAAVVDAAIVKALKSSEAAHHAYAYVRETCAATEARELVSTEAEMQLYWAVES